MSNKVNVGIVGTGIYLPKYKMTGKEISEATQGEHFKSEIGLGCNVGTLNEVYLSALEYELIEEYSRRLLLNICLVDIYCSV